MVETGRFLAGQASVATLDSEFALIPSDLNTPARARPVFRLAARAPAQEIARPLSNNVPLVKKER